MKKILILLAFIPFMMNAQLNKNIIYTAALQFGAGITDGINQAYIFHYSDKFGNIKPNEEAWSNKWKTVNGEVLVGTEKFWGSSRWFVFTTDFYHGTRFIENRLNEASGMVYSMEYVNFSRREFKKRKKKRKKWYWYAADYAIIFTARSAGFALMYDGVFKP